MVANGLPNAELKIDALIWSDFKVEKITGLLVVFSKKKFALCKYWFRINFRSVSIILVLSLSANTKKAWISDEQVLSLMPPKAL